MFMIQAGSHFGHILYHGNGALLSCLTFMVAPREMNFEMVLARFGKALCRV
jgi:hypothetical protein